MVRMLVLHEARGENDARPHPAQNAGQRDGMGRPDFEVGVAVEFEEFDRRAEERRGSPRFRRRAAPAWPCVPASPREQTTKCAGRPASVSCAMTPPQPNSMSSGCAPKASSRQGVRAGARCRLHRSVRSRRG